MSDLQTLFVILVALYLMECFQRIPKRGVVFRHVCGEEWEARDRGWASTSAKIPWIFTNPLLPSQGGIVCHDPKLVPCAHGVLRREGASLSSGEERGFHPFEGVETIEADDELILIDGKAFAKTASQIYASHMAAFLTDVLPLPEGERVTAIDGELSRMLDIELIGARLSAFQANTTLLRWACSLLFLYLFVVSPLAVLWFGTWIWPLEVLGFAAFLCLVARSFLHAHGVLYPEGGNSPWFTVASFLSPPAASRAVGLLLKDLLCTFHPLAAASVLCSRRDFEAFAARIIREIQVSRHRRRMGLDKDFVACARCHGDSLNDALWGFVESHIGPPENLLRPPARISTECKSYCPRCCTQYVISEGVCPDCEGLPLCAFEGIGDGGPC